MDIKVMYLNTYRGCLERERFSTLIKFINDEKPDVLGLSELKRWGDDDQRLLREFSSQVGMSYYSFCFGGRDYNLALLSKYNLSKTKVITENMGTGIIISSIHVNNVKITLALTHLHYINEDTRLGEVQILMNSVKDEENVIIMGDFNSLSHSDVNNPITLLSRFTSQGITKFGVDSLKTDVTDYILQQGFIDTYTLFDQGQKFSVPTKYNIDKDHTIPLRIDYMFTDSPFKEKVTNSGIICTTQTDKISDHYPIYSILTI